MDSIKRRLGLAALTLVAAATLPAVASAQGREIKIAYALAPTSHYGVGAKAWADSVEAATQGAFTFKHFPASALGGERELLESAQLGTVEAVIVSTGPVSNFVPDVGVTDIPFLFRDRDHAHKVLDGPIGQELLAKFPGRGLVALAWGEQGFRHITNSKHPIQQPADLKGLKIRTMENPVHITAFRTLGASPTPMAWPEVTGALQQGTIDGQENPISVIVSAKLSQVQKYLALTGHVYSPAVLVVSPALWGSLNEGQKKAFKDGALAGAKAMRAFVDDVEIKGVDELRGQGMTVVEVTDKAPFQTQLAPAYRQYESKYGKELLGRITETR